MKISAVIGLIILAGFSNYASAATCAMAETVRKGLKRHMLMAPVVQAVMENGQLMELYRTHDGKRWSVVLTAVQNGKKVSCLVARGTNLESVIWHLEAVDRETSS